MPESKKAAGLNPSSKAFVPGSSAASRPSPATSKASPAPAEPKKAPEAAPNPAAKPAVMAWGSKPMDAVRAAPPPSFAAAAAASSSSSSSLKAAASKQKQRKGGHGKQWGNRSNSSDKHGDHHNHHHHHHGRKSQRQHSGGGRHGGHGNQNNSGSGGSGNRNHHHHHQHNRGPNNSNNHGNNKTFVILELCNPGDGTTEAQKAVQRFTFEDLLAVRLDFLDPPAKNWNPPEACEWCAENRKEEISSTHVAPRQGGDVSIEKRHSKKKIIDTAPALEDCKPLEVNDETRWKAKVMTDDKDQDEESDEAVLKKALLILNKLSLTKFDKLSDDFIDTGIGRNKACLEGAIGLIVNKAQQEPHFANMYAQLCSKLAQQEFAFDDNAGSSKKKKIFKKLLLSRCQEEFELDTAHKIAKATEGITDKEEIDYHATLIRKHYLGHMRFIGELYKGDMIKIDIMLWCLDTLLKGEGDEGSASEKESGEVEEEKIECFAKLMTTIGASLQNQSLALNEIGKSQPYEKVNDCWHLVEVMAGRKNDQPAQQVSNRFKFMLQDLLEMRDKGWVTRRKVETAKTIEEIHQEVAKEERKAARRSSSSGNLKALGPRRASAGDVRILDRRDSKKSIVDHEGFVQIPSKKPGLKRSVSDVTSSRSSGFKSNKPKRSGSVGKKESGQKVVAEEKTEPSPPKESKTEYPSPDSCGKKAESILKEYFSGGDTDDAVLSLDEIIGAGRDGSVDRGSKVVESSVLLVMEMKAGDVSKMLTVLVRCIKESKLEKESLCTGLKDPLEFLSDIVIDAPLAESHLATIVTTWVDMGALSFDFLLSAPGYFRTEGRAASFAAKVLKKLSDEEQMLDANVDVVEQLMTAKDRESHASAKELIETF